MRKKQEIMFTVSTFPFISEDVHLVVLNDVALIQVRVLRLNV